MKPFAIAIALLPLGVLAAAQRIGTPSVSFEGKGPGGFTLKGQTDQLELKDDGTILTAIVPLATLKTGIALRDRHMREKYLETDRFPEATLQVAWSELKLPDRGSTNGTGRGKLTLHGVTRDVTFTYSIERKGDVFEVMSTMPLKMTDFGIAQPGYLGVTVNPDVVVTTRFQSRR